MTADSLTVAIEALSWIAYTGIGERAALFKASEELGITETGALREAHKWIMETSRFQNRLDWIILENMRAAKFDKAPHGIRSLFRIIAYTKLIQLKTLPDLQRIVGWGRSIIGWREMHAYEEDLARLVSTDPHASLGDLPELERLAVETCHPAWYVQRVTLAFGRSTGLRILQRDMSPVSTFARVNQLKAENNTQSVDRLQARKVNNLDEIFTLDRVRKGDNRRELASSGKLVIEDLGSIVAGLVASPKPGQVVLDLCAAPGNKTSHLAAQMHNEGDIYAVELSASRSRQWRKEMIRTGCSIATLIQADAAHPPLRNLVDVVLVDPPCTNSGVFARNPSSKWRITYPRLRELVRSQANILQAASERVVNGGTLVYCTCSILPEEDELIVESFLRKNHGFTLLRQQPFLGSPGFRGLTKCQRFYPYLHDCNGYFIAKMRKD